MEWGIQEVARLSGTTSRTLRHYDEVGLLTPTRVGANGYRHYDERALVRLQRILLLRQWGLALAQIADLLDGNTDDREALQQHLVHLHTERDRLDRQIASVHWTVSWLEEGEEMMAEKMFDGFDHTIYRDEVESRWGQEAYAASDRWWRGLDDEARAGFLAESAALSAAWQAAFASGEDPAAPHTQQLARRHSEWVALAWGGRPVTAPALRGLGEMYVADSRFSDQYGGPEVAAFVRDALTRYADRMP